MLWVAGLVNSYMINLTMLLSLQIHMVVKYYICGHDKHDVPLKQTKYSKHNA